LLDQQAGGRRRRPAVGPGRRPDLDEDINAYLTTWRVPANGGWQPRVTLRHLLTHSAGLTECWYPGYAPGAALPSLRQTLQGEPPANTPPVRVVAMPGTQYRYSGSHYSVLQQVLVDVTRQPFPDLARRLVFDPLGMHHSGYEPDFPARHRDGGHGHDAAGCRWPAVGGSRPRRAGAGLWTTPADLARLVLDVQAAWRGTAGCLLEPETARRMLTPHLAHRGLG
jgi:CubicO group peptidase (beta-lactamase class C family)